MTRRQALALFPAPLAFGSEPPIKPKALKPGDNVGLITPATAVFDPDRIAVAERTVAYFDLKLRMGRGVSKRSGYMGATVEERAAEVNDFFRDPAIAAVFAIRGGYGSAQILNQLDYGMIRRNPKIFLGFSDITAMHLALTQRAGLVTFHGPTLLSRFSPTRVSTSSQRCSGPSRWESLLTLPRPTRCGPRIPCEPCGPESPGADWPEAT